MAKKILGLSPVEALILAALGYFGYTYYKSNKGLTTEQKKAALVDLVSKTDSPTASQIFTRMTPSEIDAVYDFVIQKKKPQPGTAYYNQIDAIAKKYGIFT